MTGTADITIVIAVMGRRNVIKTRSKIVLVICPYMLYSDYITNVENKMDGEPKHYILNFASILNLKVN
jgi:hypothetical protein